jgi:hypothetical protein
MTSFAEAMPAMVRHRGTWQGIYRHISREGELVDQHRMTTICEFPDGGEFAYVQQNHLRWDNGRELERSFGGVWRNGMLWWDTDRFSGHGWETRDGIVMLNLKRKDEPGVHFIEMITMSDDGQTRARTWQWFRNGTPFRRTLCDEWRVSF